MKITIYGWSSGPPPPAEPVGAEVAIRPGAGAELSALVEALGQRPFFTDRLGPRASGRDLAGGPR